MTMRSLSLALLLAVAMAVAGPAAAVAQEAGAEYASGQLFQVSTFAVDPAHASKFEAAIKQIAEAAAKANTPYRWVFWQDASSYTLVYPVENFAYFDDQMQFVRSFTGTPGEAQMQEAMAAMSMVNMEVVAEEIVESKPDWGYEVDGWDQSMLKYAHMDVMWLRPGADEQFDALSKDMRSFFTDLGYPYPYDAHGVRLGDTGRVIYVTFIDDMSKYYGENDMMKMIESKNMSARWEALWERMNALVRRWEHSNSTYRADLSYWPMPAGATR